MRYEKRLLGAIKARGGSVATVGSRNLLSRLAIDLGMIGAEAEIEATLLALAEKDQVRIERMAGDNSLIRSVSIVKTSAPRPKTKHAQPPEPIPVVVIEGNKEEEVAVVDNTPEPLHVRLSNALVALQINANTDGLVKANSLSDVLERELKITLWSARGLLRDLGRLGLRSSENLGGGRFIHYVRMDVGEVTDAMVAQLRAKKPATDTKDSMAPSAAAAEQAETTDGDVVGELLGIIEMLEQKLAESAASLERGLEVVTRLQADQAELQAENTRLREQLDAKTAPTAKAAEVIERYRTKS